LQLWTSRSTGTTWSRLTWLATWTRRMRSTRRRRGGLSTRSGRCSRVFRSRGTRCTWVRWTDVPHHVPRSPGPNRPDHGRALRGCVHGRVGPGVCGPCDRPDGLLTRGGRMVVAVGFDSAGDAVAISLDGDGDVQLVTNGAVMWVGPGDLVAALRRLGVLDGGERPGERSRRVLEAWRRVACDDAERAAYARRHAERSFARTLRG